MKDFKDLSNDTLLRIRVPKELYESIKKKLTLDEAKGKGSYGAGMEVVKEKKASSGEKPKAPKAPSAPKKANAPIRVTPDNAVKADKDTEKMGAGVSEGDEKVNEYVGLDPDLYTAATIAGLGLPVVVAIIAMGPKVVGKALYDLAIKAKDSLSGGGKSKVEKSGGGDEMKKESDAPTDKVESDKNK